MKLEIYQIGKVPPLTVIECNEWSYDLREPAELKLFKGNEVIAAFILNNIAGFKIVNEDDEIKEATTEETKSCPWCHYNRGNSSIDFRVVRKGYEQSVDYRFIKYCPFCGRKLSDDNG